MSWRSRLLWPLHAAVAWHDRTQWASLNPNQRAEVALRAEQTRRRGMVNEYQHRPVYQEPSILELALLWTVAIALFVTWCLLRAGWIVREGARRGWRWVRAAMTPHHTKGA